MESYDTGQPTWDVPNQDLDENPNAAPPAPSAPPPDMFSNFSGYENTSFGKFLNENWVGDVNAMSTVQQQLQLVLCTN